MATKLTDYDVVSYFLPSFSAKNSKTLMQEMTKSFANIE
jgi:hypothetical protein